MAANGSGLTSIRCPSLMDAGAWLDEACEGYWDLGDHLRSVRSLAVSGDGRYIATVSDHEHRCVVHLVDPFGGRSFSVHRLLEHKHPVEAVAYASDGNTLLVATADGHVRGWEIDAHGGVTVSANLVHDHKVVQIRAGACETVGLTLLACLCADGSVWLWDTRRWCVLTKIQPRASASHLMGADAREHGTGRDRGRGGNSIWGDDETIADKECEWKGHVAAVVDCDLSPDGLWLATASRDRTCKVWHLSSVLYESHEEARQSLGVGPAVYLARVQLAEDSAGTSAALLVSLPHYASCVHCKFGRGGADDGSLLVTCSTDASCIGWHVASGEKRFQVSLIGVPDLAPCLLAVGHLSSHLCDGARGDAHVDASTKSKPAPDPVHIYLSVGNNILVCRVTEPGPGGHRHLTGNHHSASRGHSSRQLDSRERVTQGPAVAGADRDRGGDEQGTDGSESTKLDGVDCAWLLVQRQRLLKQGLALRDLPWILATRILTPHALVEALLQGLGIHKKARNLFRQMLVQLGLPKVHFLRQASTCSDLSLLAKLVTMLWSNATQGLKMATQVSWRPGTWNSPSPLVLLLPPDAASARGASMTSSAAAPRLPQGPATPRGRGAASDRQSESAGAGERVTLALPAGRGAGGGDFVDVSEVVVDSGIAEAVRFVPWAGMGSGLPQASRRSLRSDRRSDAATAAAYAGRGHSETRHLDSIRPVPKLDLDLKSEGMTQDESRSAAEGVLKASLSWQQHRAPPGPNPSSQSVSTAAAVARQVRAPSHAEVAPEARPDAHYNARAKDIRKLLRCAGSAQMLLASIPALDVGVDESVVSVVHHMAPMPAHDNRHLSSASPQNSTHSRDSRGSPPPLDLSLALLQSGDSVAEALRQQGLQYTFISTEDVSGQGELDDDMDHQQAGEEGADKMRDSLAHDDARVAECLDQVAHDVQHEEQEAAGAAAQQALASRADDVEPETGGESLDAARSRELARPRSVTVTINLNMDMGLERGEAASASQAFPPAGDLLAGAETATAPVLKTPAVRLRSLPLHTVPREHEEQRSRMQDSGVKHVVTSAMPLRDAAGTISYSPTRPLRRRPLSGVKVGGRSTSQRASHADALTARALHLNRKAHAWPPHIAANMSMPFAGPWRAGTTAARDSSQSKPPMTPRVRGVGMSSDQPSAGHAPPGASETFHRRSGDDAADGRAGRPDAVWQDGEGDETARAAGAGDAHLEEGPRPAAPRYGASESAGDSRRQGESGGDKSARMWRGAGEGVWESWGHAGEETEHAGAEEGLPGWISFVPVVLISIEPARGDMWESLASSRQAHAQLQSWWTGHKGGTLHSSGAPQGHSVSSTPRSLDKVGGAGSTGRAKVVPDVPRRLPDRLMGQQISNVQWRSSLRNNTNVVELPLAIPKAPLVATPRQVAAKDALRDAPASEHALDIGRGRKLALSQQFAAMLPGDAQPARIMRQHCFLACAGEMSDMDEFGKLVIQGPLRPVPLVHQLPA